MVSRGDPLPGLFGVCRLPFSDVSSCVVVDCGHAMGGFLPLVQDVRGHLHAGSSMTLISMILKSRSGGYDVCCIHTGSVISLTPSHSLSLRQQKVKYTSDKKQTYKIVVAVPTKRRLAFSPPALLGWTLVSLASGRWVGSCLSSGRSRVGASEAEGSIVRCFMFADCVVAVIFVL